MTNNVPFYFTRFTDGVRGYPVDFIGVYIMLLAKQCEDKRLSTDTSKLARWIGGVTPELVQSVLNEKFKKDESGYYHEVMESAMIQAEVGIHKKAKKADVSTTKSDGLIPFEDLPVVVSKVAKQQSEYTLAMIVYDEFIKYHTGSPAKIDKSQGKAMKEILHYFTRLDSVISGKTTPSQCLKVILDSWNKLDTFTKSKLKLTDINSQLINIINQLKNGKSKDRQQAIRDWVNQS